MADPDPWPEAYILVYRNEENEVVLVHECSQCYCLLPYNPCFHNCPAAVEPEDEGVDLEEDYYHFINEILPYLKPFFCNQ